jgi:hypothetical protein
MSIYVEILVRAPMDAPSTVSHPTTVRAVAGLVW